MSLGNDHIIVSTSGLNVGYHTSGTDKIILKDVNMTLKSGELVAMIGPNGVGKSTLIRTLAGIQAPLGGQVLINGKDPNNISFQERAKLISLVLTERIVSSQMTVRDLVILGRHPHTNWLGDLSRESLDKVEEAINSTRINYIADRKLNELSDGQIQKAMIARALSQDGELIILDEPTAHLDINNRVEIMQLLRNLAHENGKAILVSTHDLDLALQASDSVLLLNWNQPCISGSPEDLILSGRFTSTFRSDGFTFDKESGRFIFQVEPTRFVKLVGTGNAAYWTQKGLYRNGIGMQDASKIKIEVKEEADLKWVLQGLENEMEVHSIEELLNLLSRERFW